MRVAVVGASGNVGTAVLRELAGNRAVTECVGMSRREPGRQPPYDAARWVSVDVSDPNSARILRSVFANMDAVVCLSWLIQPSRQPLTLHQTNVDGTWRVAEAAAMAGVRQLLYVSSIGAYSPGPKDRAVGEDWPTGGVPSSYYSADKAEVERILDTVEADHPEMVLTRVRPALVMQRHAASEIARYFIGPLLPAPLADGLYRLGVPVLPLPEEFVAQAVHANDLADAIGRMLTTRAAGAFNIAAEPVLTPHQLAEMLGARHVPVPRPVVRGMVSAGWLARLLPTSPGWVDLAGEVPVLSTHRAREELGWVPKTTAVDAVLEVLQGMAANAGTRSASLRPRGLTGEATTPSQ